MHNFLPVLALVFNAFVWGVSWWPFRQLHGAGVHPLWATALVFTLAVVGLLLARPGVFTRTRAYPALWLLALSSGLTIASIILGVLLGGQLVGRQLSGMLLSVDMPMMDTGVDTPAEAAIAILIAVYAVAAWFNMRIPHTGVEMRPLRSDPTRSVMGNALALLPDFWLCNRRLWRDKLGQISLATTTLFWGAGGNLKFIVLAWAAVALGYNTTQASALTGVVAIGTAVGAVVASMRMRLDAATKVIPLGIAMGLLLILMVFINNIWLAIPFLILLGGLGGYLVVPMNALLQHRGHNLMGAGRSIAVQNFNEQACILGLGAFYSLSLKLGLSVFGAITAFGLVVAGTMWLIRRWHISNCHRHREEVEHLLHIARQDHHH